MIPLSTLLSHTLVAWTVEVDNAFELRMPHRTTVARQRGEVQQGPWLVSFALYVHCIRHLPTDGLTLDELRARARVRGPVSGLERWGYVSVSEPPRQGKRKADPGSAIVRPTTAGRRAASVWSLLPDDVNARWRDRYGEATWRRLREALVAVVAELDVELPDHLPAIRGNADLLHLLPARGRSPAPDPSEAPPLPAAPLPLSALLSKALLTFALEYERDSGQSIALGANLLRVLDDRGVPVAELPPLVGVSKEAIAHSLTVSTRRDLVTTEKAPGKRTRQARLTPAGLVAQQRHLDLIRDIERRWAGHFGDEVIGALRSSLEAIVVTSDLASSPLAAAYGPPPGTWRADLPTPATLPHYPMMLRGGGFPDGA